ncbi:hypothetical protein EDD36DRAFT_414634 [Exophiala viscosa]|uniref:Uncharacterized protein n=1 Tax=Exophiala viscosa TaxID=2486360 RepID=A0AAN6E8Z6_9EURO|nr:hypothetical protein EDD36DRAFT_414634 [Exophiala viscosa]
MAGDCAFWMSVAVKLGLRQPYHFPTVTVEPITPLPFQPWAEVVEYSPIDTKQSLGQAKSFEDVLFVQTRTTGPTGQTCLEQGCGLVSDILPPVPNLLSVRVGDDLEIIFNNDSQCPAEDLWYIVQESPLGRCVPASAAVNDKEFNRSETDHVTWLSPTPVSMPALSLAESAFVFVLLLVAWLSFTCWLTNREEDVKANDTNDAAGSNEKAVQTDVVDNNDTAGKSSHSHSVDATSTMSNDGVADYGSKGVQTDAVDTADAADDNATAGESDHYGLLDVAVSIDPMKVNTDQAYRDTIMRPKNELEETDNRVRDLEEKVTELKNMLQEKEDEINMKDVKLQELGRKSIKNNNTIVKWRKQLDSRSLEAMMDITTIARLENQLMKVEFSMKAQKDEFEAEKKELEDDNDRLATELGTQYWRYSALRSEKESIEKKYNDLKETQARMSKQQHPKIESQQHVLRIEGTTPDRPRIVRLRDIRPAQRLQDNKADYEVQESHNCLVGSTGSQSQEADSEQETQPAPFDEAHTECLEPCNDGDALGTEAQSQLAWQRKQGIPDWEQEPAEDPEKSFAKILQNSTADSKAQDDPNSLKYRTEIQSPEADSERKTHQSPLEEAHAEGSEPCNNVEARSSEHESQPGAFRRQDVSPELLQILSEQREARHRKAFLPKTSENINGNPKTENF